MKWELGALKILAQYPTVPGIALADACGEIEKLQAQVKKYLKLYEDEHEAANKMAYQLANALEYAKNYDPVYAVEQIRKLLDDSQP